MDDDELDRLLVGKVVGKRQYPPWRWARLLKDDPDVRLWYETMEGSSKAEARNYTGYLGRFLELYAKGISPKEYAALPAKEQADLLQRAINALTRKGKAGLYIDNIRKAVARWLDHNGLKFQRRIIIPKEARHRRREKGAPEPEQLKAALGAATPRMRVAMGLVAFSGNRLEVVGNDYGSEHRGLSFEDLDADDVDLGKLGEGGIEFKVLPARLHVPRKLSKIGVPTFSFVGHQLAGYIRDSVVERHGFGERLGPGSPLVAAKARSGGFMASSALRKSIGRALGRAGVNSNPNSLRNYFAQRAQLAGGDLQAWVDFYMNHTGTVYDLYAKRGKLNKDVVEQARKVFGKVMLNVETIPRVDRQTTMKTIGFILQAAGYSPEQVKEMDLEDRDEDEVVELIRKVREKGGPRQHQANGGARQRVVPVAELEGLLGEGWSFKASLGDGRCVVERG